jgi:bacillithiol system protein YtxJ
MQLMKWIELTSIDQWNEALENTDEQPLLVFKHSTTCPISAEGLNQFENFLQEKQDNIQTVLVKVIESRSVSNQIADDLGVKHESPQVILIRDRNVLWSASHWNITKDSLKKHTN